MPVSRAYWMIFDYIEGLIDMKKILRTVILLTICFLVIIISGCGSDENLDYAPVSKIRENFSQTVENLRKAEFDNLDFSNTDFSFPEIDSINELSLGDFSGKNAQELYDFFSASVDALAPGKFSNERKLNEIRFYDGENPDGTRPTIKEYTPTNSPYPFVENDDCFMDMRNGVLRWFDNAALMRWCGEEGSPIMQTMISDKRRTKDFITDMNYTDKYELTDGEISIKDAAEYVNDYLQTTDFSPYELSARKKAVAVNVVDIGKGKFGYNFIITPEYKNVLFDYPEMNGSSGVRLVTNTYDNRSYDVMPGQIDMIETDKICHFILPAYNHSIEESEIFTSIITLESAAETINKFYSGAMDFSVKRVQAVYLPYGKKAEPCWKFLMSCGGSLYNTFVNMNTGDVYVYIQE